MAPHASQGGRPQHRSSAKARPNCRNLRTKAGESWRRQAHSCTLVAPEWRHAAPIGAIRSPRDTTKQAACDFTAARRMRTVLEERPDRDAVLARFTDEPSDRDADLLRQLLGPEADAD